MRIRPPRWLVIRLAAARKAFGIGPLLLALGACTSGATQSGQEIVWESGRVARSSSGLDADGCREYSQTVTIGGEERQAFGRACLQPDGSWRVYAPADALRSEQDSPPSAAQAVPAYPSYPVYRTSVFFGSAFVFGGHRHHHFKNRHFGHRHFKRHHFRHRHFR